jgi:hypothetical protein
MFPYTLLLRFIGKKNFGFNQKSNAYHSAVHRLAWAVQKVFNCGQHRFRRNRGRKPPKTALKKSTFVTSRSIRDFGQQY